MGWQNLIRHVLIILLSSCVILLFVVRNQVLAHGYLLADAWDIQPIFKLHLLVDKLTSFVVIIFRGQLDELDLSIQHIASLIRKLLGSTASSVASKGSLFHDI